MSRYTASYADHRVITEDDKFKRFGHPGKYMGVTVIEDTTSIAFTGSNYGYGAVMVSGSYTGNITLSDGGVIDANCLDANTIYEFSVANVEGGVASDGIYVFKKQVM